MWQVSSNNPKLRQLQKLSGFLAQLTNQCQLFEMNKHEKTLWDKKVKDLKAKIKKLENEIEKFKVNKFHRRRKPKEAQRILFIPQIAGITLELACKRVEKLILRSQQDMENGKINSETLT